MSQDKIDEDDIFIPANIIEYESPLESLRNAMGNLISKLPDKELFREEEVVEDDDHDPQEVEDREEKFNIFLNMSIILCIILLFIFLSAVIYISAYHQPWIKYILLIFFISTLIFPTVADFFFMHAVLIQYKSYKHIRDLGSFLRGGEEE